jgi:hypothetical protein
MDSDPQRGNSGLKLVRPTDFEILYVLRDGERYTASIVAKLLEKGSDYISSQMSNLAKQHLLNRIGPDVDRCVLYRINQSGAVGLAKADRYEKHRADEFGELSFQVSSLLSPTNFDIEATDDRGIPSNARGQILPRHWHPNLVFPEPSAVRFLQRLNDFDPVTPRGISEQIPSYGFVHITEFLYQLYFFGLTDRVGDQYEVTGLGNELLAIVSSDGSVTSDHWEEDLLEINSELRNTGVLQPPDWYRPENFTADKLEPELSISIPEFDHSN